MTKFTFKGDITWGAANGPRSVTLMTENQAGLDQYAGKMRDALSGAMASLELTIRYLKARSRPLDDAANQVFDTGILMSDTDRKAIQSVLVKTLNGLQNTCVAIKVGQDQQMPNAGGWIHRAPNKAARQPYHTMTAALDDPDAKLVRRSAIHLTSRTASDSVDFVKHGLIHEATHKYAGTVDNYYFKRDVFPFEVDVLLVPEFTRKQALVNADSFACLAKMPDIAARLGVPL